MDASRRGCVREHCVRLVPHSLTQPFAILLLVSLFNSILYLFKKPESAFVFNLVVCSYCRLLTFVIDMYIECTHVQSLHAPVAALR